MRNSNRTGRMPAGRNRRNGAAAPLRRTALALAAFALTLTATPSTFAAGERSPIVRPATMTSLATRALMLAVTRAGLSRTVAVGEHGIVLISDDEGKTWRQAQVPVSVTLTSVQFVDAKLGWAAGHSGVILHTEDGGEHWVRQLDGATAAQLALKDAEALAASDVSPTPAPAQPVTDDADDAAVPGAPHKSPGQIALSSARRLVKEGADKPFLSLWFSDAKHGTAVGAYGLAVHTEDGGRTWQSWNARVGDTRSLHMYAVRQSGDEIWIAGEQGFVSRSLDGGQTFTILSTPYKGSFFALDIGPEGTVVLGGLRGNALRTTDGGTTFTPFKPDGDASITDIAYISGGTWLLATQSGQVYASRDTANTFQPLISRPSYPLNGISTGPTGTIVGAGFAGAIPVAHVANVTAEHVVHGAEISGNAGGQQ